MSCERPAVPDFLGSEEDEGFEAFVNGAVESDNPHELGSVKFLYWRDGWLVARTYQTRAGAR